MLKATNRSSCFLSPTNLPDLLNYFSGWKDSLLKQKEKSLKYSNEVPGISSNFQGKTISITTICNVFLCLTESLLKVSIFMELDVPECAWKYFKSLQCFNYWVPSSVLFFHFAANVSESSEFSSSFVFDSVIHPLEMCKELEK